MESSAKWKYLKILGLIALTVTVFFPDVVFDLTVSSLHFLFESLLELSHLLFEGLESVLDHLIEGLFETDLHSTQTIVFYILLAIAAYPLYWLGRFSLRLYRRCQQTWNGFRAEHPFNPIEYWHGLTLLRKIKLILIPVALVYLYVMFFV
ncbi:hypothetical protein [Methylomicrobium sp. Wu6]|uniref:hypothetical protein n=1 Tax=Methylomicrobium sp. Wu6 TaxID=3107928 RepID=UPI002DD68112|nr:hypothetical protein [Methylomicrobium sp. Wu6]MEC4749231.1 hypothetical protein [Methylomicrobium sp. Wu6]